MKWTFGADGASCCWQVPCHYLCVEEEEKAAAAAMLLVWYWLKHPLSSFCLGITIINFIHFIEFIWKKKLKQADTDRFMCHVHRNFISLSYSGNSYLFNILYAYHCRYLYSENKMFMIDVSTPIQFFSPLKKKILFIQAAYIHLGSPRSEECLTEGLPGIFKILLSCSCRYDFKMPEGSQGWGNMFILWGFFFFFWLFCPQPQLFITVPPAGGQSSSPESVIEVQNTIPCWPPGFLSSRRWRGGSGQLSDPRASSCRPQRMESAAEGDRKQNSDYM